MVALANHPLGRVGCPQLPGVVGHARSIPIPWDDGDVRPVSPVMGSASSESDSSRVRNKLRKFLQRRPTLQSLRERGYIKGGCLGWG